MSAKQQGKIDDISSQQDDAIPGISKIVVKYQDGSTTIHCLVPTADVKNKILKIMDQQKTSPQAKNTG